MTSRYLFSVAALICAASLHSSADPGDGEDGNLTKEGVQAACDLLKMLRGLGESARKLRSDVDTHASAAFKAKEESEDAVKRAEKAGGTSSEATEATERARSALKEAKKASDQAALSAQDAEAHLDNVSALAKGHEDELQTFLEGVAEEESNSEEVREVAGQCKGAHSDVTSADLVEAVSSVVKHNTKEVGDTISESMNRTVELLALLEEEAEEAKHHREIAERARDKASAAADDAEKAAAKEKEGKKPETEETEGKGEETEGKGKGEETEGKPKGEPSKSTPEESKSDPSNNEAVGGAHLHGIGGAVFLSLALAHAAAL